MEPTGTTGKTAILKELLAQAKELVVRKKNLLMTYRKRREEARVKELREKLGATNVYEDQ